MRLGFCIVMIIWCLGYCLPARAERPSYRYQAVGEELQTVRQDEDGRVVRVYVVALPVAIDSVLPVGRALYVVYAQKYIALFDISNPERPQRRMAVTAGVTIAKLGLSADGKSTLLLTTQAGETMAYTLANPLQPEPLFNSLPLQPVVAGAAEDGVHDIAPTMRTKYRDYGRLHPTAIVGIVITVIGVPLLGGGIRLMTRKSSGGASFLDPEFGLALVIGGSANVLVGGSLLVSGVVEQKDDPRLPRPAAWTTAF